MNCRRIRRSIPLLARNDLTERKARQLRVHLGTCKICWNEFRPYSAALQKFKELSDLEIAPEWTEAEWQALMARTISLRIDKRRFFPLVFGNSPLPAMVRGVAMAVPTVVIGLLLLNTLSKPRTSPVSPPPAYVRRPEPTPPMSVPTQQNQNEEKELDVRILEKPLLVARPPTAERPAHRPTELAAAAIEGSQDVVSVTLISQDTGLKVVWFLNKNFE